MGQTPLRRTPLMEEELQRIASLFEAEHYVWNPHTKVWEIEETVRAFGFEGMGSVKKEDLRKCWRPAFTLSSKDEELLKRLRTRTGIGSVAGPYISRLGVRDEWTWRAGVSLFAGDALRERILQLFRQILPYVSSKRKRIQDILDACSPQDRAEP